MIDSTKLFFRLSLFFFVVFFLSHTGYGQINYSVFGQVIDENKVPVSFANIAIYNTADSTFFSGVASDSEGVFELGNLKKGDFNLCVTAVGYEQVCKPFIINGDVKRLDLSQIVVLESVKELESIEVVGQRQAIERKIDRLVFNVDNTILTSGEDGLEILSKTPGVMVDSEGNIKINGKGGVVVMINDKRSYLTDKELSDMLRTINAENISSIEVITNPSAKFDAEGSSGILNIVLKEMKEKGYNGSVYAGMNQGRYPGANAGANINFMSGKFSGFVQADFNFNEGYSSLKLDREFGSDENRELLSQDTYMHYRSNSPSLRASLDYSLDEKNTFGIMFNGYTRNNRLSIENETNIADHNQEPVSRIWSDAYGKDRFDMYSFNLNYIHRFDTLGQKITSDIDYSKFDNVEDILNRSQVLDLENDNEIEQSISSQPYIVDIFTAKVDYEKPIGNFKLETGLKFSHSLVKNDARFDSLKNGEWVLDKYRTNDFTYEETIPAGYANFSGPISDKLSFQAGLRVEHTITNGRSRQESDLVDRKYTSFFPSAFIKHDVHEDHSLSYSYSRRVRRPTFGQLNPFFFYVDPFLAIQGNPYLLPEFSNNVQVDYIFKQKYALSLSYHHATDVLGQLMIQDDESRMMIQTNDNLDLKQNFSINLNVPVTVAKWWEMNNTVSMFGNRFKTDNEYTSFDEMQVSVYVQNMNTFLISKTLKGEFTGWYVSPSIDAGMRIEHIYAFSVGLEKSFFKEQLSLNVKARDVFRTQQFEFSSIQDNVVTTGRQTYDSNRYQITLRYKFKKGSNVNTRSRSEGNKEERNRVE
ncbi:TonB-dependent receptor domain-containing protein [Aureibacter tunicatorum]|uniref:Outer membrane protein beta-barrel domain-containing protein n=1 Tax=Aureibacter tunicatorum TaxID=866807 RepID=A0AAE3XN10_9BACT|nr:TonB-dependent receptor [Aureibacter tunicatorum]MDR6239467.1 hypothetical protein [Aureibacter tunicatorum]BDD04611.1 TonB-dependent receptor [Aureibacter tunicatorum]